MQSHLTGYSPYRLVYLGFNFIFDIYIFLEQEQAKSCAAAKDRASEECFYDGENEGQVGCPIPLLNSLREISLREAPTEPYHVQIGECEPKIVLVVRAITLTLHVISRS